MLCLSNYRGKRKSDTTGINGYCGGKSLSIFEVCGKGGEDVLGIPFGELFPSLNKEEEVIKVNDAEVKLNDPSTIDEYKKFIDKINSLT